MTVTSRTAEFAPIQSALSSTRPQPALPAPAPQAALVQELPLDLLEHVGGGSGLTLIV